MKDFSNWVKAYALQNALEFGQADAGKVLPKLFQHGLKKENIKKVMIVIKAVVKKVNSSSPENLAKEFEKYKKYVKVHEEKGEELPELPGIGKKRPVFRLAPFPSGALHIGNAKTFLLNALYAEKYKGKLILVIDDTIGSEEKQPMKEGYGLIKDSIKVLKIKIDKKIIYKSARLKTYYRYAEGLIKKDKAYVCHCSAEELRANRADGKECGCRHYPKDIQMLRWKEMFNAKEGHAVLRIKTRMNHPNPAFRDRVLFKISDREHPRVGKKYRVWPTLEMSWAVDDHLLGITHIIRGNDLVMESEMEKYIWDIFKWEAPEIFHVGFVKIEGTRGKISKSKAQNEIKSGKFIGWDDPRTWSIQSLVQRGITPEAIREFVKGMGFTKRDITIPIEALYAANRKEIDATAMRYSFIRNPREVKTDGTIEIGEVEVKIHPDKKETRKIEVNKIFISGADFAKYRGKEVRLIHLFNVKLDEKVSKITSIENKKIPRLNWVSENVQAVVLMPDGSWVPGIAEKAIEKLKKNEIIQFERFGFCRYHGKKGNVAQFWFGHS